MEEFQVETLKSGVKSLRSVKTGEVFHPGPGPWAEANALYVVQQDLVARSQSFAEFQIWDVGLGAAANALAAIHALRDSKTKIQIHSFDRTQDPAEFALEHADELIYVSPYKEQ